MPKLFIPTNKAAQLLGVSVRTLLAAEKRGTVPAPVRLGARVLLWDPAAIAQHLKARA
jgi:predicted DNA-binding transcriptional regulator AlpA